MKKENKQLYFWKPETDSVFSVSANDAIPPDYFCNIPLTADYDLHGVLCSVRTMAVYELWDIYSGLCVYEPYAMTTHERSTINSACTRRGIFYRRCKFYGVDPYQLRRVFRAVKSRYGSLPALIYCQPDAAKRIFHFCHL